MSRDRTVMMARIKNEARWIGRNLERTWQVCSKVVLWDDGSTDQTEQFARESISPGGLSSSIPGGIVIRGRTIWGPSELHFVKSPFTGMVRPKERRNELRDKNCLWSYVKSAVDFEYVLCLDGDEMLSRQALQNFKGTWNRLDNDLDWVILPFIYLWDSEETRRIDGIYGNSNEDGLPTLRFPRMFTIRRLDEQQLFDTRFHWLGSRGGIHCGSIPQEGFHQINPRADILRAPPLPVIHFGYLEDSMRRDKFKLYNEIDPNNEFEGHYKHIIGEPNRHAPGGVQLAPWSDQ